MIINMPKIKSKGYCEHGKYWDEDGCEHEEIQVCFFCCDIVCARCGKVIPPSQWGGKHIFGVDPNVGYGSSSSTGFYDLTTMVRLHNEKITVR